MSKDNHFSAEVCAYLGLNAMIIKTIAVLSNMIWVEVTIVEWHDRRYLSFEVVSLNLGVNRFIQRL